MRERNFGNEENACLGSSAGHFWQYDPYGPAWQANFNVHLRYICMFCGMVHCDGVMVAREGVERG